MDKNVNPITTDAFLKNMAKWKAESISASDENHLEKKSENIQRQFKGAELLKFYELLDESGLTKTEYIKRKLLDEPICHREDRDAIAKGTVELIRIKNEIAKLNLKLDSLIRQDLLSQNDNEIIKNLIVDIERLKEDIHKEVRKRWRF